MLASLGWGEIAVLMLIALIVIGPERLPTVAADAGRALRKLRLLMTSLTADLKAELGPELGDLDLASLHPRTFVQKHLFSDDEEQPATGVAATNRAPALPVLAPGATPPWDPDTT